MPGPFEELEKLVRNPAAPILDFGCGYGRSLNELAGRGFNNLHGVDLSEGMIARAKQEFQALNAKLSVLTGSEVPYANQSFEAILLVSVLTCIPDSEKQRKLIDEIKRLLKPGGKLVLCDFLLSESGQYYERYEKHKKEFTNYGTFVSYRNNQTTICRHYSLEHLHELLKDFKIEYELADDFQSMKETQARSVRFIATYQGSADQ